VLLIITAYTLVTLLRTVRADFSRELWQALGSSGAAMVFTRSEVWVTLAVIIPMGLMARIRDNRRAFYAGLAVSCLGLAMVAIACWVWRQGGVDAFGFMVAMGIGLYLPYIAVHATLFERFIALTRDRANLGFLMYLADTAGYLAVCVVMLIRGRLMTADGVLPLFLDAGLTIAVLGIGALVLAGGWMHRGHKQVG
jgi:hypothetical protein